LEELAYLFYHIRWRYWCWLYPSCS